jgi:hypothetical protein
MAALSVQTATPTGTTFSAGTPAAGGDTFPNDGATKFYVKNGSGGSVNVTFACPNACNFGVTNSAHNLVVAVPAATEKVIGPFNTDKFNDAGGLVTVTTSAQASVTVAAIK